MSARMIGLPLTIATTSGPCSFVQPATPAAMAITLRRATILPLPLASLLEAGCTLRPFFTHRPFATHGSDKSILLGKLMARLISGRCSRPWDRRGRRARHRRLFALGLQCAINRLPDLVDRLGA